MPRVTTRHAAAAEAIVAGIRLSHPARLIYADLQISKQQLAEYYFAIERWIVPHVEGRPLTLLHCPAGIAAPCAYLKHAKAWGPNALQRVRIQEKTKVGEYLVANDIAGVVALAQMGIVEIHTWNSTIDAVERPNRIVWDLDPGPEVAWAQTVQTALLLREVLSTLGLQAWVKTTGGQGLHVVAPIVRQLDWSACLTFSRQVSEALVRTSPSLLTTAFARRGRDAKILIDYLRNNRTNTSVCAYSPRARPGAPVSMPLDWSQLSDDPARWTLLSVPRHLRVRRQDPWTGYWTARQRVSAAAIRAVRQL